MNIFVVLCLLVPWSLLSFGTNRFSLGGGGVLDFLFLAKRGKIGFNFFLV